MVSHVNIVAEAPGKVWFTLPGDNAIGSLVVTSTVDFSFSIFPIPTAASEPYDLAIDGESVWFTERAGNKIGRFNLSTEMIVEYDIPTADSMPTGIDIAPNGQIWFVEQAGNKFGQFDPDSETFTEYTYEVGNAQLADVTVIGNQNIWAIAPPVQQVVQLDLSGGTQIRDFPVSEPGGVYTPSHINTGENPLSGASTLWVSADTFIGSFAPGTTQFWLFYPSNDEDRILPTDFVINTEGLTAQIWFVEPSNNRVGRLNVLFDGDEISLWRQPLPSANSVPTGIAVDPSGDVWITEQAGNAIAKWSSPYFEEIYLPFVVKN